MKKTNAQSTDDSFENIFRTSLKSNFNWNWFGKKFIAETINRTIRDLLKKLVFEKSTGNWND